MDFGPLGSSVHRVPHARILERVAITFSRGSFQPRDWTMSPKLQADSLLSEPRFIRYENSIQFELQYKYLPEML